MASTGSSGRQRRGGRRVVLAGQGDGWSLWVPEDLYRAMSPAERADLAERQAALLKGGLLPARGKRRPALIAND